MTAVGTVTVPAAELKAAVQWAAIDYGEPRLIADQQYAAGVA